MVRSREPTPRSQSVDRPPAVAARGHHPPAPPSEGANTREAHGRALVLPRQPRSGKHPASRHTRPLLSGEGTLRGTNHRRCTVDNGIHLGTITITHTLDTDGDEIVELEHDHALTVV